MERRARGEGTNTQFRHHQVKRRKPEAEQSDARLLRAARQSAAAWQKRLAKERQARS